MTILTTGDQTTISYSDNGGPGDPVLLVHGITENATAWDPVADRLGADYRVITMDLRGHGGSGKAERYDLEAMAGDVVAVMRATDLFGDVHLVGHSLGGAVVSAAGAVAPIGSVVNVDQSLQLGAFKGQLVEFEAMLRDSGTFEAVIDGLFAQLAGPKITAEASGRIRALRRPDQEVVLGVWELMFTMTEEEVDQVVAGALAGYADKSVPYLSLFGADPGPDYADWLSSFIAGAQVEVWPDYGHYPHLVDPDRFTERLRSFWE
ncbi:MAG: alpha/beta hydrolase [Actinomycetia bacterium]|nr:alpha/beta hydrolase [Actinomycetes bacterium]MCP4227345.1 alpha/beta hydrolase [Actinomycetes bacterium]MCP5034931.1 alpha/beta hydrolase [Actinomycetes bacterium]